MALLNSFNTKKEITLNGEKRYYQSLPEYAKKSGKNLDELPYSILILLENMLRFEDGVTVTKKDIEAVANWKPKQTSDDEIQFRPSRIILQDFTGVPAVADLAAMRAAIKKLGGDPEKVNPVQPADLVIDHSVQVDFYGTKDSITKNADLEFHRNKERYEFLKWGQSAFKNFRVVPPATGIVHQVNLEYLAHLAMHGKLENDDWIYPDTLVGTDSHTTMINGLGVVGWGVGGIEAEAAMLGQPITMLIPEVVGFKMTGELPAGATATDLVLTVTQMLRKKGVVGKFVEFFGPGMSKLKLADRATLANMAPEYGATIGVFPVDKETINYLNLTGRDKDAAWAEAYFKAQGLWVDESSKDRKYSDSLELDLRTVVPCLAGPSRPQDRIKLTDVARGFEAALPTLLPKDSKNSDIKHSVSVKDSKGETYELHHGSVVIAAITSCTNTSNPALLLTAGILAQKAVAKGLRSKPWVKTSLAPGSKVVTDYLNDAGLMNSLEDLGFNVVGYGCTTCIGNSGPLPDHIASGIHDGGLVVSSVLSGNRNFEGRISPQVRSNFLASPPLVVAYALAGDVNVDITTKPLGRGKDGKDVFLKDIWPTTDEVQSALREFVNSKLFTKSYSDVFKGPEAWQKIKAPTGNLYQWDKKSTYIKEPPFFEGMKKEPDSVKDIKNAQVLALLGDSVTTDHISPAGAIQKTSPAGKYLIENGIEPQEFNSFGARRGNHEVMIRGTFGNTRVKNALTPNLEGPFTKLLPEGKEMSIYEASMTYQKRGTDLVVLAGKEYGTGSSRDWAAKGTKLLGVRAVIAESFERIHRSNLIGMGVLPLQFKGTSAKALGFDGTETFSISGLNSIKPRESIKVQVKRSDGKTVDFEAACRIDTPNELEYYKHGGILQYVLRQNLKGN